MKKLYGIPLILLGSGLEIYYYFYRFSNDGIPWYVSLPISLAMTLFLTAALFYRKQKGVKWLIAGLIVYSVMSTQAGQSMSLDSKLINQNVNDNKISRLQSQREKKQNRYNKVESMVNNSITDFSDYWDEWKNTTIKYETEMKELQLEIDSIDSEIDSLLEKSASIGNSDSNTYIFYNQLFGLSVKWGQFVFQLALSIFIALMSPYGLILVTSEKPKKREQKTKPKKTNKYNVEEWESLIWSWIKYNWHVATNNNSFVLLSYNVFMQMAEKRKLDIDEFKYDKIKELASNSGIIEGNTIIIKDQKQAFKQLIGFMNSL